MIWYAVISTTVAAGLAGVIVALAKRGRRLKVEAVMQADAIRRLKHVISRQEEVAREATQARKKISTGTDSERFDASLDVLSERPADFADDHD